MGALRQSAGWIDTMPGKIRLLIVDDDPLVAEFLSEGLKDFFGLIVVASNVSEARSFAAGPFAFDGIICDYDLPDGNGLDFFTWLRKEKNAAIPFLMISGKVGLISPLDAQFGFLEKPMELKAVVNGLQRLGLTQEVV